jgi:hypothetical protein
MLNTLTKTVQQNLRDFRRLKELRHIDVAKALNERIGGGVTPSQSQSNERAEALPYRRLEALAEIFDTEAWQFFVEDPPGLEELRKSDKATMTQGAR